MDWLELLLRLLMLWFVGIQTPVRPAEPPPPPVIEVEPAAPLEPQSPGDVSVQRILTVVESVDARLLESFPVQIHLQVQGYQPDGCDVPTEVKQLRQGNHVQVEIYRTLSPAAICPMILRPYDESIPLDGGFEPGTYTIDVNGVIVEVTI